MKQLSLNLTLALACLVTGGVAHAQIAGDKPTEIQNVGIDDHRGEQVPLDLEFADENGDNLKLSELFAGERPVLLSLNYSDCPMLCKVQLNGLCDALKQMDWTAGNEFVVVSVSIDPKETPVKAKETQQRYLADYGRESTEDGWRFLTGDKESIGKLARAVGFRYQYIPETQQYAHAAATIVCTPDGVVSRYLYGVMYDPSTVRLSMVEAGDGQVGSAMDQIILFCFHYDEAKGRYGPMAERVMTIAGAVTVVAIVACLTPFWVRRPKPEDSPETSDPQAT